MRRKNHEMIEGACRTLGVNKVVREAKKKEVREVSKEVKKVKMVVCKGECNKVVMQVESNKEVKVEKCLLKMDRAKCKTKLQI